MIYQFDESIPTDVAPYDPVRNELHVTKGLVYRVEIVFPPGSFGLSGIRVFSGSFQLWPTTPGKWFKGDNVKIAFDELYRVHDRPYLFLIETYNRDVQFVHSIFLRLGMVSERAYIARFLPTVAYEIQREMFEEISRGQEEEQERQLQEIKEKGVWRL